MTRRERLERKLEKREEWAGKATERSARAFEAGKKLADQIPLGQPILVGHHSERHARRDAERITNSMHKGVEESRLAEHHEAKAEGLANQLERSVFSDDPDAIEQLRVKIDNEEREQAKRKAINKAYAKAGSPKPDDTEGWRKIADAVGMSDNDLHGVRKNLALSYWGDKPFPGYAITNASANVRRLKKRIEEIERRQAKTERAEAAGGVLIAGTEDYVSVTFAEKPEREILDALKAAGFCWGGGSWNGRRDRLPETIEALAK
jgi:hypothetical protein